jgi:hypothetical protein
MPNAADAPATFQHAVLVLRWFLDTTRVAQSATDNQISTSTACSYPREAIGVLARRTPKLESAVLAAKIAGHGHISIDSTLIETDRCRTPDPTPDVDLWWSGKHANLSSTTESETEPNVLQVPLGDQLDRCSGGGR